jgi:hypothetical protein
MKELIDHIKDDTERQQELNNMSFNPTITVIKEVIRMECDVLHRALIKSANNLASDEVMQCAHKIVALESVLRLLNLTNLELHEKQ